MKKGGIWAAVEKKRWGCGHTLNKITPNSPIPSLDLSPNSMMNQYRYSLVLLLLLLPISSSSSTHASLECYKNPPVGDERGKVMQIASLCSYVSGKHDSKTAAAVILFSDVWGYGVPKLRKIADKVASAGYYVVVPDMFFGDPNTNQTKKEVWLPKHRPEKAVKYAKRLIKVLKAQGISKVAAAGFCWGGKVVAELAKEADLMQVAALLHPSYVTIDDIKGVNVDIAILLAELDKGTPLEYVKQVKAALKAKPKVEYLVKVYPGMPHGWTTKYRDDNATEVKYAKKAHRDLVDWLRKTIHPAL